MSTTVLIVNLSALTAHIQETDPGRPIEAKDEIAFIVTPCGYVRLDKEAIHSVAAHSDELVTIPLYDKEQEGSDWVSLTPKYQARMTVGELVLFADKEEPLSQYVRRFGSRIENNYRLLLSTLSKSKMNVQDDKKERVVVNGDRIIL